MIIRARLARVLLRVRSGEMVLEGEKKTMTRLGALLALHLQVRPGQLRLTEVPTYWVYHEGLRGNGLPDIYWVRLTLLIRKWSQPLKGQCCRVVTNCDMDSAKSRKHGDITMRECCFSI